MTTADTQRKARRGEPINKHTAKNGRVSYWFQADVGVKPDGSRDRQRFTYRTKAEAQREYRRITSEVAAGRYSRQTDLTVAEACDAWLDGRRGIRRITLEGYRNDLKPVCRHMGGKKLAQLTKRDGDALVEWLLTEGRTSPKHARPGSLMGRVVDVIAEHPEGVSAATLKATFPGEDVHTCLSGLIRAGRVTRPRRAVYVLADAATSDAAPRGVKPVSVRATLKALTSVVQSYVDQGALPRNVIALVERPADPITEHDDDPAARSWTVAEVAAFRASVADHRLFACWLLSCYGMRRSEVLGLRWSNIDGDVLKVRRGRVAIGNGTEEGLPKSRRSRRDLPMPAELAEALRTLKTRQRAEALALGLPWSDDQLVATHEDGSPVRPEWYSDEFGRLRERAGLRRIPLKGLRNTSVSLMLASGIPVHITAGWHGHDPAVSLSIYSDAQPDDLRAAGTALYG
ncbi:tyrosine-type recombinase/integrase [Gordonia pseudamarae]|jgi:integrase|uniref:Tyrosine-type recombinase/integrase n=1 Tax=Gordonia pseudamarae TaxID=2831662 RepID=A0ABX6IJR4_9ACTN|nr:MULTISPECIES: site-specific integrase [Gordonia]MBD0024032.1 site-specific integrase [Gordonia sp. (in: high G+C Gram-positive bacteria)]QHN26662.1 tyrosine-type recombinase/integrase [Gordonia pseudamarae]QHN35555.1 tyrosine-type recombinase/integrase [Gordonia pseudamarae]